MQSYNHLNQNYFFYYIKKIMKAMKIYNIACQNNMHAISTFILSRFSKCFALSVALGKEEICVAGTSLCSCLIIISMIRVENHLWPC